jgi:hypothetical protein
MKKIKFVVVCDCRLGWSKEPQPISAARILGIVFY